MCSILCQIFQTPVQLDTRLLAFGHSDYVIIAFQTGRKSQTKLPRSNPNPPSGYNLAHFHSSTPLIRLVLLNPPTIVHS